jgi:hypothetical protein
VRFKKLNLNEYILLRLGKDYVDTVRQFAKSSNVICGITVNDLTKCSYQDIKHNFPELIDNNRYEDLILKVLQSIEKKITLRKVLKSKNQERLLFLFWIQEQYKLINRLEEKMLTSSPTPEQVNAGIHTLNVLGDTNIIDVLSGGDVLKWDEVRAKPYATIFEKQLRGVLMEAIMQKLDTNRKNKRTK